MDRTNALVERLFRNAGAALELYAVYLGEQLGLYRALAEHGPATSVELAERTHTNERYIREWLEHHAVSGLVDVDDTTAAPTERRYTLPPEHVPVLADPDNVDYHGYKGVELARAARMLPDLVEAYRTGAAPPHQPWEPEGRAELREPHTSFVGSVAFFPERYGPDLIRVSLDILAKKPVPPAVFVDHKLVTPMTVDHYYPNDGLLQNEGRAAVELIRRAAV